MSKRRSTAEARILHKEMCGRTIRLSKLLVGSAFCFFGEKAEL